MNHLRPTIVSLVIFTVICGVIYPLLVTVVARVAFPGEANGSIIKRDGKAIGSELIAQPFTDPKYFWGRPSAAGYNGASSSGSNYGPMAPALVDAVKQRIADLRAADPSNDAPVPVDLVTASGSGLDPHISVGAARYQVSRVARVRGVPVQDIDGVVNRCIEPRTMGVLGEPRVNVLKLNLQLDHPEMVAVSSDSFGGPNLYRWRGVLPDK
jgi:K+-transporting ATPase ATPase C chain